MSSVRDSSATECALDLQALFEHMLNGFAYCRMIFEGERAVDFVYLAVNNAFETLTGLKDVVGRRVTEVIPGIRENDPGVMETYGRVTRTGVPETFEAYVNSLKMWFAVAVYRPAADHFVAVFDVITQRKEAEAALREASQLNQQIVADAQEGIIVYDLDLGYKVWNPYMEAFTGVGAQDVLGKNAAEVFPFLREAGVIARLRRALAGQTTGPIDFQFQVPQTGRRGWASNTTAPLRSADGKIIGIIATVRDITYRKSLEVEAALRQQQLNAFFTSATAGLALLDKELRFLQVNDTLAAMNGLTAGEHLGKTVREVVPSLASAVEPVMRKVLATGEPVLNFKLAGETPSQPGRQREWLESLFPIVRETGRVEGVGAVVVETTEVRRLEEQLFHAQKMEAIGLLAGGVAHDFRNQLTVIKGYGEMLRRRSWVKEEGRENLEEILQAAERSIHLTGQLLAFSRRQELRPEVVNVDALAGEIVKSLAGTLGENIRLSVLPCGGAWSIRVDTGLFQQAMLNLVLNARDAMPQGGQLTIETGNVVLLEEAHVRGHAGASAGRHVVLSVSDTGEGIAPEVRDHLFEPFFTTKSPGEGTGLGLAMVHGFVAQSGGFIEVHSRSAQGAGQSGAASVPQPNLLTPAVPRGTTFRLYFPAVEGVAESAAASSQATDLPQGTGTVLVVEDEPAIRRMLLDTLRECGYAVLSATNGQEAMALIASAGQKIDLLISDVVMPGWNGPELARHFRAARPDAAVLLVSGHTGKMLTANGVVPSDVHLLVKPFSSESLAGAVQTAMQKTIQ